MRSACKVGWEWDCYLLNLRQGILFNSIVSSHLCNALLSINNNYNSMDRKSNWFQKLSILAINSLTLFFIFTSLMLLVDDIVLHSDLLNS